MARSSLRSSVFKFVRSTIGNVRSRLKVRKPSEVSTQNGANWKQTSDADIITETDWKQTSADIVTKANRRQTDASDIVTEANRKQAEADWSQDADSIVRSYLLRFLPLELANVIIEIAKYWPYIVNSRGSNQHNSCDRVLCVQANEHRGDASNLCLVTPPLPVGAKALRAQFTLHSHGSGNLYIYDEGYGGCRHKCTHSRR